MIDRRAAENVRVALADRPVVLLHGARQTGKTTLVRALAEERTQAQYVTLDDLTVLSAARTDPAGFLAGFAGPIVLDEIQRVPELLLAIKAAVDWNREPGRFLLTGSTNVLFLPRTAESLAGRMEIVTLWPFSQGEMAGIREGFVDAAFGEGTPAIAGGAASGLSTVDRVLRGGFPEAASLDDSARRAAWFDAYITALLQRNVRDLAHIEGLAELPRLLSLIAARPTALLNYADLARSAELSQSTAKRYLALLEATFLVRTVPPWHANLRKRFVKSPKVLLCDTGIAAHLMGVDAARIAGDRNVLGGLLENFVAMELVKQLSFAAAPATLFHLRTHEGDEVDFVLERRSGELVGIEVKSRTTVTDADFKGLRTLQQLAGPRFHRGLVLYTGKSVIPFGPRLHAIPLDALYRWGAGTRPTGRRTSLGRDRK